MECGYAQLSSWAWYYSQQFTQRTLPAHWSAFRFCCDVHGMTFPLPESVCWRRMRRVMRALRLRDPTVERRCFPLVMLWLLRMMHVDGVHSVADVLSERFPLARLVFWARVMVAHRCMMRGCEHAGGMLGSDLRLRDTPNALQPEFWGGYYELAVGSAPPDLEPRFATNRKLKLRAARTCLIPVRGSLTSAGLWLLVMVRRLYGGFIPDTAILFPDVRQSLPRARPMTTKAFIRKLRVLARAAGMDATDVSRIEIRSLRAAGCTDAFAGSMPRALIMRQGGWTSDAVDLYNRPAVDQQMRSFASFWA